MLLPLHSQMSPCVLSAKSQSFAPHLELVNENCNLFLIPLTTVNSIDIIMIYGSQIFQLDPGTLEVKEEILLESPIEAFHFDNHTNTLNLKLTIIDRNTDTETSTDDTNSCTESELLITTVTSGNCTWSFDCPNKTLSLCFNNGKLISCTACESPLALNTTHKHVIEVIKNDHVAAIQENHLQILSKSENREIISSAKLIHSSPIQSLIWIDESILVFTVISDNLKLHVAKYNLMQFITPTNGCNWPLVTWSMDCINVHRAGAICPTWYTKLKNSEVWDVLNSPVGEVRNVQVSADGSCLLVCAGDGVAFCDFISRSWQNLPFKSLLHPKWLGNDHVVALTPDTLDLILISKTNVIFKIPVEDSKSVIFIDTYNNWQLLLQTPEKIIVLAFNYESTTFTYSKSIEFSAKSSLKQAAFLRENLFTLNHEGEFTVNDESVKHEGCESFLVLSTGHLLLVKRTGLTLWKDEVCNEIVLNRPISVLPFVNCLTILYFDDLEPNFALTSSIQSKFLLADLFFASEASCELLQDWSEDPLYQLALEYILLGSLGKDPVVLKLLESSHSTHKTVEFSKAVIALTRKIEVHEASEKMFKYLNTFTPEFIVKTLCDDRSFEDVINFLPYLAKSENTDAIVLVLNVLFTRVHRFGDRIVKVKEYLVAFDGLDKLFNDTIKSKIGSLWETNRPLKAFYLMKYTSNYDDFDKNETLLTSDYFKTESLLYPELVREFESWMKGAAN